MQLLVSLTFLRNSHCTVMCDIWKPSDMFSFGCTAEYCKRSNGSCKFWRDDGHLDVAWAHWSFQWCTDFDSYPSLVTPNENLGIFSSASAILLSKISADTHPHTQPSLHCLLRYLSLPLHLTCSPFHLFPSYSRTCSVFHFYWLSPFFSPVHTAAYSYSRSPCHLQSHRSHHTPHLSCPSPLQSTKSSHLRSSVQRIHQTPYWQFPLTTSAVLSHSSGNTSLPPKACLNSSLQPSSFLSICHLILASAFTCSPFLIFKISLKTTIQCCQVIFSPATTLQSPISFSIVNPSAVSSVLMSPHVLHS